MDKDRCGSIFLHFSSFFFIFLHISPSAIQLYWVLRIPVPFLSSSFFLLPLQPARPTNQGETKRTWIRGGRQRGNMVSTRNRQSGSSSSSAIKVLLLFFYERCLSSSFFFLLLHSSCNFLRLLATPPRTDGWIFGFFFFFLSLEIILESTFTSLFCR